MSARDPWLHRHHHIDNAKHDKLWEILNLEKYSTGYRNLYPSTDSTLEGSIDIVDVVSKYIELTKESTMNDIRQDTKPAHLFFDRMHVEEYVEDIKEDLENSDHKFYLCKSWADLPELLQTKPKSICFHANELNYSSAIDIVNMVRTLGKLVNIEHEITVTVAVDETTSYETVKQLQKTGIFGIIPAHRIFGWDECFRGLKAQWANIPYWPKHIMDQLPGAKKKETTRSSDIKLTSRQQQIYDLVSERGLSNKHIAKTLNITESTVKLHMGNILQKFGAKNRTQLVAFKKQSKSYKEV